jgi:hypothetical protein
LLGLFLLLGLAAPCPAHAQPPAAHVPYCASPSASAPLLAHWSDLILNNRARMIQVAFIFILVGIYVLRR